MAQEKYPQEAKIITDNTYMDDIIESVGDRERAESVTRNIEKLVDIRGFKIKGWTISGSSDSWNEKEIPSEMYVPAEKVLGVCWRPVEDLFCFKVTLNFSGRKRKRHTEPDIESHQLTERFPATLTKWMILSQINSIYDPLGLAGPFTIREKIMMRKLWMSEEEQLDWDDPVSDECRAHWNTFFSDLVIMNNIKFGTGFANTPNLAFFMAKLFWWLHRGYQGSNFDSRNFRYQTGSHFDYRNFQ